MYPSTTESCSHLLDTADLLGAVLALLDLLAGLGHRLGQTHLWIKSILASYGIKIGIIIIVIIFTDRSSVILYLHRTW
jgi:hypothetical protein